MKKLAFVLAGTILLSLIVTAPAVGQNGSTVNPPETPPAGQVVTPTTPPPTVEPTVEPTAEPTEEPTEEPTVGGEVVTPPQGTAFTGADVQVWMVLAAGLVVLGVALVIVGRRRRAAAAKSYDK